MSEREIELYRRLHTEEGGWKFAGLSILPYAKRIKKLIREVQAETLLDYGCGKGRQYSEHGVHRMWKRGTPALYDPAVAGLDVKPAGTFDGVLCCDVAEHIPEEEVGVFLADVMGYARKFVFMTISCAPADKRLPDGRNCHLTVRPPKWWAAQISSVKRKPGRLDIVFVNS